MIQSDLFESASWGAADCAALLKADLNGFLAFGQLSWPSVNPT
jgi:hypothetical protein